MDWLNVVIESSYVLYRAGIGNSLRPHTNALRCRASCIQFQEFPTGLSLSMIRLFVKKQKNQCSKPGIRRHWALKWTTLLQERERPTTNKESGRTGSNRRQRRWQRRALPTELRPQKSMFFPNWSRKGSQYPANFQKTQRAFYGIWVFWQDVPSKFFELVQRQWFCYNGYNGCMDWIK